MRKTAILLLMLALAGAAKDKPGKGQAKGHAHGQTKKQVRVEYYDFRPEHRTVIVDYYRSHGVRSDLPPGILKQLRRKGHLPPGLQKKMVAFPPVLIERLPPVPYGCERAFVGNIAVIWNPRTRIVFDFFAVID